MKLKNKIIVFALVCIVVTGTILGIYPVYKIINNR